jgi:hypothetical protein
MRTALLALALLATSSAGAEPRTLTIDAKRWAVVERDSGPVNYYTVVNDPDGPLVHSDYKVGYDTTSLGIQLADSEHRTYHHLKWKWRAEALPVGGNECASGKGDSAADIYVIWKRGLKWYALKYVWSTVGPLGKSCDRHSNPFKGQETVIMESGGPLHVWKTESIDLDAEWRKHFADGDATAEVPDLMGLGLLSDGDQTKSPSSADYGGFVFSE